MSKDTPKNPHNNLFIKVMSNIDTATNFLRHFLPDHLQVIIDLKTLELISTDFYDEELKVKYCDLLYRANFNNEGGFLAINLEHQSKPDKFMPYRQLIYKLMAANKVMESTDLDHLPVIYGMTFYHDANNKPYPYSCDISDLFGKQSKLAKQLLLEPFKLIDVNAINDDALLALHEFGYMAYTLKHGRNVSALIEHFEKLVPDLQKLDKSEVGRQYIEILGTYLASISENHKYQELIVFLASKLPNTGDKIMSMTNIYFKDGKAEGLAEGLAKGEHSASVKIYIEQLQHKFGPLSAEQVKQLEKLIDEDSINLSNRIIDAKSINEIFDDIKH